MPSTDRANAVLFSASSRANVWVDFNAGNQRATGLTVLNDGPESVYAEVLTANGALASQVFGVGATTVALPGSSGVTVGTDSEGVPFLMGVARIMFRDPA